MSKVGLDIVSHNNIDLLTQWSTVSEISSAAVEAETH